MRALVALLLLLAAATVAWFVWSGGDETPPPGSTGDAAARGAPAARAPSATERSEVPVQRQGPDRAGDAPAKPAAADAPAAPTAPPTVILVVRDLSTRAPVPAFRWRFRGPAGQARGEGTDGRAELALAGGALGEVLVEADGFAPFAQADFTVPAPPAAAAQLDVFLRPAVLAAGITLLVHDLALQPITHVRVDAFPLSAANRESAWHLGKALWARRTEAADGRYVLPPLPSGEYGVRVVATDPEGALLPLLPYLRTFTLTGDNGFLEDVPLEPGALPVFELVDSNGTALDAHGEAPALQLHLPGGPPISRRWVVESQGSATTAIDTLPGTGPTWPAEAVPAGMHAFEVRIAGDLRVQLTLLLRAGERQVERVVVP
ncbi:MAG TPA: hypothetical protein VFZ65_00270 [Planctomycetota bacterium]|nr:hypothetical protein [Planctomycetota bacterium]